MTYSAGSKRKSAWDTHANLLGLGLIVVLITTVVRVFFYDENSTLEDLSWFDHAIMLLSRNQFDFMFAFAGFFAVRYMLANKVANKEVSIKVGLVLALFYALFGHMSRQAQRYRNDLEKKKL